MGNKYLDLDEVTKGQIEDDTKTVVEFVERVIGKRAERAPVVSVTSNVIRYEVECPQGTDFKRLISQKRFLEYDLMCAADVIMEAPVMGTRRLAVEVPRFQKETLYLKDVVERSDHINSAPMTAIVGESSSGEVISCNLERFSHLLVGGQTESGKSCFLNSFIISLMNKSTPEQLQFVLIDTKQIEFCIYSGSPFLAGDVLSDGGEALRALEYAVEEMDKRYAELAKNNVENIRAYSRLPQVKSGELPQMPHVVFVIDEFGVLMLTKQKRGILECINELAAKGFGAGYHIVISSQHPSCDVLPGSIRANIPNVIAFKVARAVDSRMILDTDGAEDLLGDGDMLYYPAEYAFPVRLRSPYISREDILETIRSQKSE